MRPRQVSVGVQLQCEDSMSANDDRVWVSLDYVRGGQVTGFRGQMDAADLEAILAGGFTLPFVTLENVHWIESVWNDAERRSKIKVTVYGRHGTVRGHTGTLYLRPEHIASIAPLYDCEELLADENRFRDEE
jgi:hypothetical protein